MSAQTATSAGVASSLSNPAVNSQSSNNPSLNNNINTTNNSSQSQSLSSLLSGVTTTPTRLSTINNYLNSCISRDYNTIHRKSVRTLSWNRSGNKIASSAVEEPMKVWNIDYRTGNQTDLIELKSISTINNTNVDGSLSVTKCVWSPINDNLLLSAGTDKTVRIWDIRTPNKCASIINTPGENINICISDDSNYIAIGNRNDCISIIDYRKLNIIKTQQFNGEINQLAFNRGSNSEYLLISSGRGTFDIYSINDFNLNKRLTSISAHSGPCFALEIDKNNSFIATGGADALIGIFSISPSIAYKCSISRHESPIQALSFNSTGEFLASISEDLFIDIADINTTNQLYSINVNSEVNCIAFHPHELLLAYATEDSNGTGANNKSPGNITIFGFH